MNTLQSSWHLSYNVGRKVEEPAHQQEKMACYGTDINLKTTRRTLRGLHRELIKTNKVTLF